MNATIHRNNDELFECLCDQAYKHEDSLQRHSNKCNGLKSIVTSQKYSTKTDK